jgi:hypothetical protein
MMLKLSIYDDTSSIFFDSNVFSKSSVLLTLDSEKTLIFSVSTKRHLIGTFVQPSPFCDEFGRGPFSFPVIRKFMLVPSRKHLINFKIKFQIKLLPEPGPPKNATKTIFPQTDSFELIIDL